MLCINNIMANTNDKYKLDISYVLDNNNDIIEVTKSLVGKNEKRIKQPALLLCDNTIIDINDLSIIQEKYERYVNQEKELNTQYLYKKRAS